jgi:excisionase family DNA binding protein
MPLTKQEAANLLGVTIRSIEGYVKKGRLSVAYTKGERGNIAVFDEQELEKLKAERDQVTFVERPATDQPHAGSLALMRPDAGRALAALVEAIQSAPARPSANVSEKLMLTLADASALTSLSVNHLREALHAGRLKGKIIGRGYKIKRTDLDTYIKKL